MKRLARPKADTLEVVEVVPWCTFAVCGLAAGFYAWRGYIPGVRYTLGLAGLSMVAAAAIGFWQNQTEAAERNAKSAAQRAQRHHIPPGRATVTAELPPSWRRATPDHH